MGPACVAAQREPFDLPEHVLNTMAEARAPSTRRLYALKFLGYLITLAYSSLGLQCPIGEGGIASSWAWSSGVSILEICKAAGWSSSSTFVRFYNLDVPALQARVLSV